MRLIWGLRLWWRWRSRRSRSGRRLRCRWGEDDGAVPSPVAHTGGRILAVEWKASAHAPGTWAPADRVRSSSPSAWRTPDWGAQEHPAWVDEIHRIVAHVGVAIQTLRV